jgi:Flp pilus assembly protein TadG
MPETRVRTRRAGLAAVELALTLPIVAMLVMGTMEYGLALNVLHTMTGAAQDAARQMAVQSGTAQQAQALALSRLSGFKATFTVTATQTAAGSASGQDVTVLITVPWSQATLTMPLIPAPQSMHTQVTMHKEGS